MGDIEIVRWKRYGKDRIYVKDAAGAELGWVDLLTGDRTVTAAEQRQAFDSAVNAWYVDTAMAEGTAPNVAATQSADLMPTGATPNPTPTPPEPPTLVCVPPQPEMEPPLASLEPPAWHDLATHVPGQAAREQALRELASMRERSRVGTFIARALDMKTDERAWRVGAGGEETVGARLEKLTKHGWHVLHAVPVGKRGSDIDHVLIGHGGVYTINTKNHPGGEVWVGERAIRVNGHPVQYLRNSRFEAERAGRLLSQAVGVAVPVKPVLVFLTGTLIPNVTIKRRPPDVLICDRMDIPGDFKRAPRRLAPDQILQIHDAARRCTTWTGSKRCSCA